MNETDFAGTRYPGVTQAQDLHLTTELVKQGPNAVIVTPAGGKLTISASRIQGVVAKSGQGWNSIVKDDAPEASRRRSGASDRAGQAGP